MNRDSRSWVARLGLRLVDWFYRFDWFISYSRKDDQGYAKALSDSLVKKGFSCCLDKHEFLPGGDLAGETLRNLSKSDALILVCTPRAFQSPYVLKEVRHMTAGNKLVVPIDLDDTLRSVGPGNELRGLLGDRLRVDEEPGYAKAPSEGAIAALVRSTDITKEAGRRIRLLGTAATVFLLLAIFAVGAAFIAYHSRNEASRLAQDKTELAAQKTQLAEENADLAEKEKDAKENALRLADENAELAEKEKEAKESALRLAGENADLAKKEKEAKENALRLAAEKADLAEREKQAKKEAKRELAHSSIHLGDVCVSANRWKDALSRYDQARSVFEEIGESLLPYELAVVNMLSLNPEPVLRISEPIMASSAAVAYSPDGKTIAAGDFKGKIRLWDATTGLPIGERGGHKESVTSLQFSPDAGRLVSGSQDKTVRVWDLNSRFCRVLQGQVPSTLKVGVESVSFSPSGDHIVSGSYDGTLKLWDARDFSEVWSRKALATVRSVAYMPDERFIVVGGRKPEVGLVDSGTGDLVTSCSDAPGLAYAVAVSPAGDRFASGHDRGRVVLWDATRAEKICEFKIPPTSHARLAYITSLAFSRDGLELAAASWDGSVHVWDTEAQQSRYIFRDIEGPVWCVSICPEGSKIVSSGSDPPLKVWALAAGRDPQTFRRSGDHPPAALDVGFFPDGLKIVTANLDNSLQIWDLRSGQELLSIDAGIVVKTADVSRDGSKLLVGVMPHDEEPEGSLTLWDVRTRERIRSYVGHTGRVSIARFSPDGQSLVSGDCFGEVIIWDVETGQEKCRFEDLCSSAGSVNWVNSAEFSPDARHVLAASDMDTEGTIMLWDIETRQVFRQLTLKTHLVTKAIFSTDGKRVIAAGTFAGQRVTYEILLIDLQSSQVVKRAKAHDDTITCLAQSSDGTSLLSGSVDGSFKVWDMKYLSEIRSFTTIGREVLCACFGPKDRAILVGGSDGTVELWDLDRTQGREEGIPRQPSRFLFARGGTMADYLVQMGGWFHSRGAWDMAIEALEQAESLKSDVPHILLGQSYWAEYDRLRKRNPGTGDPGGHIARRMAATEHFEKALGQSSSQELADHIELCLQALAEE